MYCCKTYKLSRPFLFVNKEESLTDAGQQFIDFILSPDGQVVVSETGQYQLTKCESNLRLSCKSNLGGMQP